MSNKFYHSVHLETDLCRGCIHCLKRCPTQAIRVINRKAMIISELCIDCSECITHCPYHAKVSLRDRLSELDRFQYKTALIDPSIYGQFNNLTDPDTLLSAFLELGFDDVFEVGLAYEYLAERIHAYIDKEKPDHPLINSTCPSITRLIRVRFPDLIDYMVPMLSPAEISAMAALAEAEKKSGLPREAIGIVYISPCPALISYAHEPLGTKKTHIDACLAMKDLYKPLLGAMKKVRNDPKPLSRVSETGARSGMISSEAKSLRLNHFMAADGIENVIRILNAIEDEMVPAGMQYIELKGCSAGCVGGVLNVENPHIARSKVHNLAKTRKKRQELTSYFEQECGIDPMWSAPVTYEKVLALGDSMAESMKKMGEIEDILRRLPRLDCGSCGAPTCQTMAEDIVRGVPGAAVDRCIYIMRGSYARLQREERLRREENY